MKEFVINLLKTALPSTYYFHDYNHTLYVLDKSVEIGKQEGCTEDDIRLLSAAALWHDVGYINIYKGHEEESCVLAKKYLPGYGFDKKEIDLICGMIMATRIPQSPKNKLEQIIADADLEYFGTDQVDILADQLFRELRALDPALSEKKWNQMQISFLEAHRYFTKFCKQYREPIKHAYLLKLLADQ